MKIFVLAGNYEQFKYYYPKPDKDIIYLTDISQIFGHRDFKVARVGTWYENKLRLSDEIEMLQKNL